MIERVANAILIREQEEKVRPQIQGAISGPVPVEAYDAYEQLTYIVQVAQGKPIAITNRAGLTGPAAETYRRMVEQHIREHPFLQQGELTNDVLASIVLAHAVGNSILDESDLGILRQASRLPFLWRSVQSYLEAHPGSWILGYYLGCILNSLWNDSIMGASVVRATPSDEDPMLTRVAIQMRRQQGTIDWAIDALHPLELYEQLQNCDFRLEEGAVWQGHYASQEEPSFEIRGKVIFLCSADLDIRAATVRVDGDAALMAERVAQQANVRVSLSPRSKVWWGGDFVELHPWRDYEATLDAPIEIKPKSRLERLLKRSADRIEGIPLRVYANYRPTSDPRLLWISREFSPDEFAKLLALMVKHELAQSRTAPARGPSPELVVHFTTSWDHLLRAFRAGDVEDPRIADFLAEARVLFGESTGA